MGSDCLTGTFSVLQDEKSYADDGGNDCTTIWMYLIPLNCILKNSKDDKFCYVHFTTKKIF